ncbi:MAG: PAS domain-containing sensor histidine kinase [Gammaproteobacteria bacterium]|nr:PAS domain-containing sensor histidine kinase [Gammaproteobacteria bacterium]
MSQDDAVVAAPRRPWFGSSLWLPIVLVVLACSAIVYYGHQVVVALEDSAAASAGAGARATAREISGFIDREHERLTAFAAEHNDAIRRIVAQPHDWAEIDALQVSLKRMFRGAIAFAITDAVGEPVFEDFEGLVGPVCQAEMKRAIPTRIRGEGEFKLPPIHPVPGAYHFDLISPWKLDDGRSGLFFVSMSPGRIAELIGAAEQASGTRIILVNRDDPSLIEVTSAGSRDRLGGDFRVKPEMLSEGHFAADLPGTHWRLLVVPDRAQLAAAIDDVYTRVVLSILGLLAISGTLLYLIRRAERRNSTLFTRSLQASLGRQRAILQSMVDALVTIDETGRILNINSAVTRLFGYEPGELVGSNVRALMPEPDRSAHDGYLRHYLDTGETRIIGSGRKVTARRKDGSLFPVLLTIGESVEGEQRIFVGILHDLSESEDAQRKIIDQAQAIERSRQELDEISQIAAKDLQVPLQRIALLGEKLGEERGDALSVFERSQLKSLTDEARDMSEVVKGIAEYARTRRSGPKLQAVDLEAVLETLRSDFTDDIEDAGARLKIEGSGIVQGDEKQIRQVLWNLIDNAIKFRDPLRLPEITITIGADAGDPGRVAVSVSDNGIGIPEEALNSVFEAFWRLNPRDGRSGMGLGLSFCRKIVSGLGGEISVSSTLGEGSRFEVLLPRAE